MTEVPFDRIEATLKRAVGALRAAGVEFLLAGSLASWARSGPETRHDLDLIVRRGDAERALEALSAIGMRAERPVEEWLLKAWDGDVLVDLIFEPSGLTDVDALFERGEELPLLGLTVRTLAIEDLLATKLLALTEHHVDFTTVLRIARALREQVDWPLLRARTRGSPFASAFLVLAEELGIAPPSQAQGADVRVIGTADRAG